ncbi:hypothetical protein IMZ11_41515 [Microtetraspora sp. AC03309]|uniref:hypothetical protein n=1 Tax=Microtetraspora sp. AC03309 TaxID=2779376 RepID=UPI001E524C61|nr:hypothetical protein [Microtetraspora sp. AC03309]MCC5582094.1 hypothetical protein [Microtetraspora sp. AC03309]
MRTTILGEIPTTAPAGLAMAPAGILATVAVPSVRLPAMLGMVFAMGPLVTPVTAFSVTLTTVRATVSVAELLPFFVTMPMAIPVVLFIVMFVVMLATRPMTMPVGTFLAVRVAASIGTLVPVPMREASVALPLTASASASAAMA